MVALEKLIADSKKQDRNFRLLGVSMTTLGVVLLFLLVFNLVDEGWGRISWDFLSSFPSRIAARAGLYPAIVGSCLVMIVTVCTSVPLGVATAIYLEEYARKNWVTEMIEINISNLAGVPSIVYGLMALGVFVQWMNLGHSIAAAGLTLGCLCLPVVIVISREALRTIPNDIREAAIATGATQWQMVWHHLLPYSFGGILTGVIIALSRAIGETAPLVTIGALSFIAFLPPAPLTTEAPFVSFSWLASPFTVLPMQMFNWISRPSRDFHENAAAAGVVLMVLTLTLNAIAIFVRYRSRRRIHW